MIAFEVKQAEIQEEMQSLVDYVKRQDGFHQDGMQALMNKIDHSAKDSANFKLMVDANFDKLQKTMKTVSKDNTDMKRLQTQFLFEFSDIRDKQMSVLESLPIMDANLETFKQIVKEQDDDTKNLIETDLKLEGL